MFRAIITNEIEEVRRLLDKGADASSCIDEEDGQSVGTLICCIHAWDPRPEIAELLLQKGARLASEESKAKFVKRLKWQIDYGLDHETFSFQYYMPLLRVFAKYGLLPPPLIDEIILLAPEEDREGIKKELIELSLLLAKKESRGEVIKNAYMLCQAKRKDAPHIGALPNDVLIKIAALTGNPSVHDEKKALSISKSYFRKPIPPHRLPELKRMIKGHINDYLGWTGFHFFKNNVAIAKETLKAIADAKDAETMKLALTQSKNKLSVKSNQSGYLQAVDRALYELEYFAAHPKILDALQRNRSQFLQFN